jgi:DNA mismatch endonuclease, patch repair protein
VPDIFSKKKRSRIMASISGKETKPEIAVRSYLFKQGFRFRKNVASLPGKPDIVLPKYLTVVLIHGCFWHGHKNCKKAALPTSNTSFWQTKIAANVARDKKVDKALKALNWRVITVWQCQLANKVKFEKTMNKLIARIQG